MPLKASMCDQGVFAPARFVHVGCSVGMATGAVRVKTLALGLRDRPHCISWSRLPSGDLPAYAAMDVFAFRRHPGAGRSAGRCRGASGRRPRRRFRTCRACVRSSPMAKQNASSRRYDASKARQAPPQLVEDRPLRVKCPVWPREQARRLGIRWKRIWKACGRHIVPSWDDSRLPGPGHGISFAAFPAMTIAVLTNAYPPTVLGGAGRIRARSTPTSGTFGLIMCASSRPVAVSTQLHRGWAQGCVRAPAPARPASALIVQEILLPCVWALAA